MFMCFHFLSQEPGILRAISELHQTQMTSVVCGGKKMNTAPLFPGRERIIEFAEARASEAQIFSSLRNCVEQLLKSFWLSDSATI